MGECLRVKAEQVRRPLDRTRPMCSVRIRVPPARRCRWPAVGMGTLLIRPVNCVNDDETTVLASFVDLLEAKNPVRYSEIVGCLESVFPFIACMRLLRSAART